MQNNYKLLPYGMSDFATIRKENKYYVDKTMFIPNLEKYKYQMFLRPRRFGKSLMLNMLAAYYDVASKDDFDLLFNDLYIGKHPTEERNKYLILKFNFSKVDPDERNVEKSFEVYIKTVLKSFVQKYSEYLPENILDIISNSESSNDAFTELEFAVNRTKYKIYVIIDEYDNFANTMLADSENNYKNLTHGEGFFRLFFNNLKSATTDNDAAVSRIMISGVTPLTLSDVTSGYNIGTNISTNYLFNSLAGFTETEFREMLEYYKASTGVFKHSVDELIEITKPWYDNNCFSERGVKEDRLFNSDMALYFLREYITNEGDIPTAMVDTNIISDYNKMTKLISFEQQFGEKSSLIQRITTDGEIYSNVKPEFSLNDLDCYENLVSLMFYMGLLSIGEYDAGDTLLIIPNATVRQQYYQYLQHNYDAFISWKADENIMTDLGRGLAKRGEHEPFIRYVANCMTDATNNRDFDKFGEAFVKGFFMSQFGTNLNYYTSYTEHYLGHGFSDIYLEPRLGTPYAYVIELKYCKHSAQESEVNSKLEEARIQLPKYITDKKLTSKAKNNNWNLKGIILVFKGWELVKYVTL